MTTNGYTNGVISAKPAKVPIVDLEPFTSMNSTPESRKATATQLHTALSQNGGIGIRGHGISPILLDQAFAVTKSLFDLPYESKMLAPHPDAPTPHRGYSGIGREAAGIKTASEMDDEAEKAEMAATKDYKESYEIGHPDNKEEANIWLPEHVLPGFQMFMLAFQKDLNRLATSIFEALILSLSLTEQEADSVRALNDPVYHQLRLAHYPPIPKELLADARLSRLGAHRDWSLFTMLFQDNNGGLEFHDKDTDTFVPATPIDGVMYLNVGDMFHRLSNGIYPSALHRVVIPGKSTNQRSAARYSIPFFVSNHPQAVIAPQPSLVTECGRQVYEPVTFEGYSEAMFAATQTRD